MPVCGDSFAADFLLLLTALTIVQGSEDSASHAVYVWDHVIEQSSVSEVVIVAHSYGGVNVVHLVISPKSSIHRELQKTCHHSSDICLWLWELLAKF